MHNTTQHNTGVLPHFHFIILCVDVLLLVHVLRSEVPTKANIMLSMITQTLCGFSGTLLGGDCCVVYSSHFMSYPSCTNISVQVLLS